MNEHEWMVNRNLRLTTRMWILWQLVLCRHQKKKGAKVCRLFFSFPKHLDLNERTVTIHDHVFLSLGRKKRSSSSSSNSKRKQKKRTTDDNDSEDDMKEDVEGKEEEYETRWERMNEKSNQILASNSKLWVKRCSTFVEKSDGSTEKKISSSSSSSTTTTTTTGSSKTSMDLTEGHKKLILDSEMDLPDEVCRQWECGQFLTTPEWKHNKGDEPFWGFVARTSRWKAFVLLSGLSLSFFCLFCLIFLFYVGYSMWTHVWIRDGNIPFVRNRTQYSIP